MAEFKIGDKVVRKSAFQDSTWSLACARSDRATDGVFVIDLVSDDSISVEGLPGYWGADCFRLATSLEEHQDSSLPAEDRLRESDAHIECLRELLDIEKQKVSTLQAAVEELRAEVARCCGHSAAMEEKIAKLLSLNHELSDQVSDLQAEARKFKLAELGMAASMGEASSTFKEMQDQRDAAVLTAKALGEDLRRAREEMRWARFARSHLSGLYDSLFTATADIDLSHVASQLRLLAQMCEEHGNGADAALAYNAAQVVELTAMTLASLDEVQEYAPSHFPPMEGPLA